MKTGKVINKALIKALNMSKEKIKQICEESETLTAEELVSLSKKENKLYIKLSTHTSNLFSIISQISNKLAEKDIKHMRTKNAIKVTLQSSEQAENIIKNLNDKITSFITNELEIQAGTPSYQEGAGVGGYSSASEDSDTNKTPPKKQSGSFVNSSDHSSDSEEGYNGSDEEQLSVEPSHSQTNTEQSITTWKKMKNRSITLWNDASPYIQHLSAVTSSCLINGAGPLLATRQSLGTIITSGTCTGIGFFAKELHDSIRNYNARKRIEDLEEQLIEKREGSRKDIIKRPKNCFRQEVFGIANPGSDWRAYVILVLNFLLLSSVIATNVAYAVYEDDYEENEEKGRPFYLSANIILSFYIMLDEMIQYWKTHNLGEYEASLRKDLSQ